MRTPPEAIVDAAIERLRAGETLRGSFLHEHGLDRPFHEVSELRFDAERGDFVFQTGGDAPRDGAPGYDSERRPEERLDEAGARVKLTQSLPLRSTLGLR